MCRSNQIMRRWTVFLLDVLIKMFNDQDEPGSLGWHKYEHERSLVTHGLHSEIKGLCSVCIAALILWDQLSAIHPFFPHGGKNIKLFSWSVAPNLSPTRLLHHNPQIPMLRFSRTGMGGGGWAAQVVSYLLSPILGGLMICKESH